MLSPTSRDCTSYTAYARFADKIEEFAERGGVIVFGACDGGWSAGYMSDIIPGGVKKHNHYTNYNTIVDSQHPIVTGVLTDNKVLTNSLLYSNYCSHVYFDDSTFPEGTRVILREQNGYPTLTSPATTPLAIPSFSEANVERTPSHTWTSTTTPLP